MSTLKGQVGPWQLEWSSIPQGATGSSKVRVGSDLLEVSWVRDAFGISVDIAGTVHAFDITPVRGDDGVVTYSVNQRLGERQWQGVAFRRAGEAEAASASGGAKKSLRIKAQMPGKVVRVLIKEGSEVAKDQPLAVMEAMKMENEIRAPQAGVVKSVSVTEGQAVESGAELLTLV